MGRFAAGNGEKREKAHNKTNHALTSPFRSALLCQLLDRAADKSAKAMLLN
jgi:hypothetical protein